MSKLYKRYKKQTVSGPSFTVGQKAFIINDNGEVLLIRRHSKTTQGDLYDFPGGRIDYSESLRKGLCREVKEETSMSINLISFPLAITTFLREIDRNNQIVRIIYLCKAEGEIHLSEEHSDYIWIDPQDYHNYKYPDKDYHLSFKNYLSLKLTEIPEFLHEGMLEESITYLKSKSGA